MTLEAVRKIARDSQADSLLCLIVDRPKTHRIRVVAQCYNSPGELLWREEATERLAITGGQGLRTTLHKLHEHAHSSRKSMFSQIGAQWQRATISVMSSAWVDPLNSCTLA
jgi:hypothetical protein